MRLKKDLRFTMVAYNKAMASARRGFLDPARVRRALGIIMSNDGRQRLEGYQTTIRSCDCPDIRPNIICKHRIAVMIQFRAVQYRELHDAEEDVAGRKFER